MRSGGTIGAILVVLVGACGNDDGGPDGSGTPDASAFDGAQEDGGLADGGSGADAACPQPLPVTVDTATGSYHMDSTEVPVCRYTAWLATAPTLTGQHAWCGWNTSYDPSTFAECATANSAATLPVVCIDWCDAEAYCRAQGERLCGKIGGGFMDWTQYADAAVSEWYRACSGAGTTSYPYGATYDPTACVGADFDGTAGFQPASDVAQPVGAAANCQGNGAPWHDLFDLSGNAQEWEDACDLQFGRDDSCLVRGGGYATGETLLACDSIMQYRTRDSTAADIGFRCCAD